MTDMRATIERLREILATADLRKETYFILADAIDDFTALLDRLEKLERVAVAAKGYLEHPCAPKGVTLIGTLEDADISVLDELDK